MSDDTITEQSVTLDELRRRMNAHGATCDGKLRSTEHLDGDTWFSSAYRCDVCDASVLKTHTRRPHGPWTYSYYDPESGTRYVSEGRS
jgi:hypothetical protein